MSVSKASSPQLVLRIAYDGSRFFGSQSQPKEVTVQGTIESALSDLVEEPSRVRFAGRTDRGVHATGQVIACRGPFKSPPPIVVAILHKRLKPKICIQEWALATLDFDPRHHALRRRYRYTLRPAAPASPFLDQYSYPVSSKLDWSAMEAAAGLFVGKHNFISFATRPSEQKRLERSIERCSIEHAGETTHVVVEARGFLRGQVRNIVGALLAIGHGTLTSDGLTHLLSASTKGQVPKPAPPVGLYLEAIDYAACHFLEPFTPFNPEESP